MFQLGKVYILRSPVFVDGLLSSSQGVEDSYEANACKRTLHGTSHESP